MQKLKRRTNFSEKAITLIALVVTIVILLILAGVTITMTLGQNGLFQKAQLAGIKTNKARDLESITLSVQNLIIKRRLAGNENKITAEELKEHLKSEGIKASEVSGEGNLMVKHGDNEFIVKQSGEVLENDITKIIKQGDYINYSSQSLSGGENWRVFYIDDNKISIVSTYPVEMVQATNNGVTEESVELTKQFVNFLKEKRTSGVNVNIGRDKNVYPDDEIVLKNLNYYSEELAESYSLSITMEDIKKALGLEYTDGENIKYDVIKEKDKYDFFPLTGDCIQIATYWGDLGANKNSIYMFGSNKGGIFPGWLMSAGFSVGTKIKPIVHLKENIKIVNGDGSKELPYILTQK